MKEVSAQQTFLLNQIYPTIANRVKVGLDSIALAPLVWAENWFSAVAHGWLTKQGLTKNRSF
jgi:hypothetical protein